MSHKKAIVNNIKLIFSKKGLRLAFGSYDKLSYEEKIKSAIPLSIYSIPLIFLFTYIFFNLLIGINFLPFFFACCSVPVMIVVYSHYYESLNKKYGETGYGGFVVLLNILFAPLLVMGFIALGIVTNNVPFGIGGLVASVFPLLVMFIRINTFSDESRPQMKISDRTIFLGPGYMPISYFILSFGLGIYTTGRGFSAIHFYLTKGSPSLEFCLVSIIVGLIVQSIVLFPDKINKIVPIDLRTKKGFVFMFILTIVLFIVSSFIIGLFNPEFRFELYEVT